MDKIQQDFEDTFSYIYSEFSKDCCGEYILNEVQSLWLGWKAAHSKYHRDVVMELPFCYHICGNGDNYDRDEMLQALDKAGVKYK